MRAVEEALAPLAARPHWGKVFDLDRFDVAAAYPRVAEFRSLASRFDPQGRLRNDFLERTVWARRG
nr:D-arabinono-1,4-lactone oxidase [Barrientosiimonas endolithica]